jgi:hypothetical protein
MLSLASRRVSVTGKWAKKVIDELTATGQLESPDVTKHTENVPCSIGLAFTLEEEVFLLALRIVCPYHPNTEYVTRLKDCYSQDVSASKISVCFRDRYD